MDLNQVPAGKIKSGHNGPPPPPIQLSLFPKKSLRPAFRVSSEIIDRVMHKMTSMGLIKKGPVNRPQPDDPDVWVSIRLPTSETQFSSLFPALTPTP